MLDHLEVYRINEAFLDLSSMPYSDVGNLARRIRKTVGQHMGIPFCVGIAPTTPTG